MTRKKAIVAVSFGTTYLDALQQSIGGIEEHIRRAFPGYEVRRAFTSRMIVKRLAERDGLVVDNEQQALEKLQAEGYDEVYVQPLHVVAGAEYEKVRRAVVRYAHQKAFQRIKLGRPLLYYTGQPDQPDDYLAAIQALMQQQQPLEDGQALVMMGHGGDHPANTAYAALQIKFVEAGLDNALIYTVEGFPALATVIKHLQARGLQAVRLLPFMLVAGDHVHSDMAADDGKSAKSQLEKAGFQVELHLQGLGAYPAVQQLYVDHLRDAINSADGH